MVTEITMARLHNIKKTALVRFPDSQVTSHIASLQCTRTFACAHVPAGHFDALGIFRVCLGDCSIIAGYSAGVFLLGRSLALGDEVAGSGEV